VNDPPTKRAHLADVRMLASLAAGQPVQTNLAVAVPVNEAPGNGVAEISRLTGPGAVCFATVKVSVPKGVVNVASRLAGMNSAVLPSLVGPGSSHQSRSRDRSFVMHKSLRIAPVSVAGAMLAALPATTAVAAPTNAPYSFAGTADCCPDGTFDFVVSTGQSEVNTWSPAFTSTRRHPGQRLLLRRRG
jgi:hypothetical protein